MNSTHTHNKIILSYTKITMKLLLCYLLTDTALYFIICEYFSNFILLSTYGRQRV